ncbi:hypothetical protein CHARACLAT_030996 [Characodon lateralis]|uniref:Uncharacterized protein n=1 Tax=Characodon lateralis TaxID=208331 RepID=A0ABU7EY79_9TELE|nr:hypothetical protein [Characodon lateralis]
MIDDRMTSLDPVEEFMSVCQQRDISALCPPPIPMNTGVEEKDLLERGGSYSDRGIMGSLPPFPQLLEWAVVSGWCWFPQQGGLQMIMSGLLSQAESSPPIIYSDVTTEELSYGPINIRTHRTRTKEFPPEPDIIYSSVR